MQTTSRLWIILKTLGDIIETEVEHIFKPDFVNKCDAVKIEPMANFQPERYLGTWYEQAHVKEFDIFQPGDSKCIEAKYTANGDGTFKVSNTYQNGKLSSISEEELGKQSTSWGSFGLSKRKGVTLHGKCNKEGEAAQCYVSFGDKSPEVSNYNIISTDYDNYTIVYDCKENAQQQIIWILSRKPVMDESVLIKMMTIIHEKIPNFNPKHFDGITYQGSKCTYE